LREQIALLPTTAPPTIEALRVGIRSANARLATLNASMTAPDYIWSDHACCVATVAWLTSDRAVLGHLGDGAAVLLRSGLLTRCTDDHLAPIRSHLHRRPGETDNEYFPRIRRDWRNNPTATVGTVAVGYGVFDGHPDALGFVAYADLRLQPEDYLLLVTDGFARVPDHVLSRALLESLADGFDGSVARLAAALYEAVPDLTADDRTAILVVGPESNDAA
jgi:serine/threonine protein phosphatase PrpC